MKHLRKSILLLCLVTITTKTYTRPVWQHITTPHYDILFPDNITREAQRLANTLETVYLPISNTLQINPTRIPIVLQNNPCIANAFITLGPPRQGVFYTFPMAKTGFLMNNDWLNALAVHELRHVAQFEYLSWLNMFSFLAPEYAWVMEGDAVTLETILSAGGRGRSPEFSLLYKVNLLERGGFSYYKQMFGSLKHEVPDHYRLGYFMTTYLRRHYGADAIRQLMLRDGFWQSLNPFAFHTRIKKLTGMSVTEVYEDMQLELKTLWEKQLEGLQITPTTPLSKRVNETYTDYSYPQATTDGVIALKSGLGTPPQFVKIDAAGKEQVICTPIGLDPSIPFSVAGDTIIWLSNETWLATNNNQPSFTTIQSYNLQTKRFKAIGTPDRYYAISLSPDGKKIAACLSTQSYNHGLRVLDAETGDILQQFCNPENHFYINPSWSSDSQQVLVVSISHHQASIKGLSIHPHAIETLLPATSEVISTPVLHNGYLYYGSPYSGIDNIYALHLKTKKRYQVTCSKYGAYNPTISADGKRLMYNDFGRDGMNAVEIRLDPQQWVPLAKVEDRALHYYEPLLAQEQHANVLETIPQHVYPVERLKAKHRFPIYGRPTSSGLGLGVEIVRGDLLNKLEWVMIGGRILDTPILSSDNRWLLNPYTKFIWKAWRPIISLELGSIIEIVQKEKKHPQKESNTRNKKHPQEGVNYVSRNALCLKLPFRWYAGEYKHSLILGTQCILSIPLSIAVKTDKSKLNPHLDQFYLAHWSRMSAKSSRDLYSPWGQELIGKYHHDLLHLWTYNKYKNNPVKQKELLHNYMLQCKLYFPGLWNHSYTQVHTSFSSNKTVFGEDKILILKFPPFIEGIGKEWTTGLRYGFPIAYPDRLIIGWPQRIATHFFYDYKFRLDNNEGHSPHLRGHSNRVGFSLTLDGYSMWIKQNICLEFSCKYRIKSTFPDFEIFFHSN